MTPRHELTAALVRADKASPFGLGPMSYDELLDWLMPAVFRIARARAAHELRAAAEGEVSPSSSRRLRARADELDWQEEREQQCPSRQPDGERCILTAGHLNAHVSAAMNKWVP